MVDKKNKIIYILENNILHNIILQNYIVRNFIYMLFFILRIMDVVRKGAMISE